MKETCNYMSMKKTLLFACVYGWCAVVAVSGFANGSKPMKGDDDIDALKNSTLVVVLLEENQKYEDKLTKSHRTLLLKAYQDNIKTVNANLQAMVPKYLNMAKSIDYKTISDIIDLPAATRAEYSFLVYDRSMQFSMTGASNFAFDFYADNQEELKGMRDDYDDYIQFDCADPKYHGEEDYRRAIIIVKGHKKVSDQVFIQSYDMIIPTQGSMALCFTNLQKQFDDAVNGNPKKITKDDARHAALEQVAKARTKMLWVCKDNLDRNITEIKIGAVFKYKFKLVTRQDFDNAILNKDTSCCLLVVYPADKVQGGFKPNVSYEHQIVDAETDEVLLSVVPDPMPSGQLPSYQKITDKHFKDIVKAEDDITK
jgi:hypothetical protein